MSSGSKMPKAKDLNKYSGIDVVAQSIFDAFAEFLNSRKSKQHRNNLVSINSVSIFFKKEEIGIIIDKFITPKGIDIDVDTYSKILSEYADLYFMAEEFQALGYVFNIKYDDTKSHIIMTLEWGK